MTYYNDTNIVIRDMKKEDVEAIHAENLAQGWHSDIQVYQRYYDRQEGGSLFVLAAEYNGGFAGYTTLRPQAVFGPFANQGIPEISDLSVFVGYRNKGIASKILDIAENIASQLSHSVSLGVGLHAGYGSAQRLYVKRGYVPDGSGVWYQNKPLAPYSNCCNDDDLVLYLSKIVRPI